MIEIAATYPIIKMGNKKNNKKKKDSKSRERRTKADNLPVPDYDDIDFDIDVDADDNNNTDPPPTFDILDSVNDIDDSEFDRQSEQAGGEVKGKKDSTPSNSNAVTEDIMARYGINGGTSATSATPVSSTATPVSSTATPKPRHDTEHEEEISDPPTRAPAPATETETETENTESSNEKDPKNSKVSGSKHTKQKTPKLEPNGGATVDDTLEGKNTKPVVVAGTNEKQDNDINDDRVEADIAADEAGKGGKKRKVTAEVTPKEKEKEGKTDESGDEKGADEEKEGVEEKEDEKEEDDDEDDIDAMLQKELEEEEEEQRANTEEQKLPHSKGSAAAGQSGKKKAPDEKEEEEELELELMLDHSWMAGLRGKQLLLAAEAVLCRHMLLSPPPSPSSSSSSQQQPQQQLSSAGAGTLWRDVLDSSPGETLRSSAAQGGGGGNLVPLRQFVELWQYRCEGMLPGDALSALLVRCGATYTTLCAELTDTLCPPPGAQAAAGAGAGVQSSLLGSESGLKLEKTLSQFSAKKLSALAYPPRGQGEGPQGEDAACQIDLGLLKSLLLQYEVAFNIWTVQMSRIQPFLDEKAKTRAAPVSRQPRTVPPAPTATACGSHRESREQLCALLDHEELFVLATTRLGMPALTRRHCELFAYVVLVSSSPSSSPSGGSGNPRSRGSASASGSGSRRGRGRKSEAAEQDKDQGVLGQLLASCVQRCRVSRLSVRRPPAVVRDPEQAPGVVPGRRRG